MIFAEKEPGKPLNGSYTFAVLVIVIFANLLLFIVIRTLLNLENDMDQPYIDEPFRTYLQYFLLYFSLSFCFGCWCCCCGGGLFLTSLKKIKFCHVKQNDALDFAAIHKLYNRLKHVKPNADFVKKFRRKNEDDSNSEDNENDLNVASLEEVVVDGKKQDKTLTK
uniref:Ion_trans domain-containing protein n=1 Tax=Strongyloides venezuelensis TaxID=75913 RepID=A0A0K0FLJ1_STRVS